MGSVRSAKTGFFPLDEELALLPGSLTPHAHECLVRLGTWIPSFGRAAEMLGSCLGVVVSEATMRRQTEGAGAAYEAIQTEEVGRLARELPASPVGPEKLLLSVDGAMVPLLRGEWAEVKTLVLGEIGEPRQKGEEWVVHTRGLSYFSRLVEAEAFGRLALVETHRRGVEKAQRVVAVTDGAEWEQKFIDLHRYDAERILDFPHAAERVSQIGQALWGEGQEKTEEWLRRQLHSLKHQGPLPLLTELRALREEHPQVSLLAQNLHYLEKRAGHMQYPYYQTQGWPIGSGAVESGNKVVVEARLKGAGKHWAVSHVNPMLALRNVVCNGRWEEAWPQIAHRLRQEAAQRRRAVKERRRAQRTVGRETTPEQALPKADLIPVETIPTVVPSSAVPVQPVSSKTSKEQMPYRPPPDHPWRHSPIGRARYRPPVPHNHPKI